MEKAIEELIKDIKEHCVDSENDIDLERTRMFITVFCLKNDIAVDTYNWDWIINKTFQEFSSLIISLYKGFPEKIQNPEDYDGFMCEYLV